MIFRADGSQAEVEGRLEVSVIIAERLECEADTVELDE